MKSKIENLIKNHYEEYDEESRLNNNSKKIEFLTTWKYIEKFLKKKQRILDVGAGTGAYSIPLAKLNHDVTAIELANKNIEILKQKSAGINNLEIRQGNALDLSYYGDNLFDIVLVFGPMYHLFSWLDKKKAIKEAVRVCKPNGIIMFAYLTQGSIVAYWGLEKGNLKECKKTFTNNYALKNDPKNIFSAEYIDEFKKLFVFSGTKMLHNVATDGISSLLSNYVNNLSDEDFKIWLEYHMGTCERPDMQGYSSHMLYICKKMD